MENGSFDSIVEKLKNGAPSARYMAASRLGKSGNKAAVDHLILALKDGDEMVLDNVIFALGELKDRRALPVLIKVLKTSGSERLRKSAAKALGMVGDAQALDPLITALDDPDFKVRKSAARSLGIIGDKRAVPALNKAAEDMDLTVSKHAREALEKIQGPK